MNGSTHSYSQSAQTWITQIYLQTTPCLPFLRKRSPDGATTTEAVDTQLQLTTHLLTRRYERLSWPGWLTYSGWLTHISDHPSATGRALAGQRKFAGEIPTFYRCCTQPTCHIVRRSARHAVLRRSSRALSGSVASR